jgi:hypothetical protein
MTRKPWRDDEVMCLKNIYTSTTKKELMETFPDRSYGVIIQKASELGLKRPRIFSDEEIRIILDHYSSSSVETILSLLPSRDWETIRNKAIKLGKRRYVGNLKWSVDDEVLLKDVYTSRNKSEIMKFFPNRTWNGICSHAQGMGLIRDSRIARTDKTIKLNFSKIDTEEKAYILGFVSADGYLSRRGTALEITLSTKDLKLLEWIRDSFCEDYKIDIFKKNAVFEGREYDCATQCRLRIHSTELCTQLHQYNLTSNKSLNLQPPPAGSIPNELMPHYLRGLSDGDGDITYDKRHDTQSGAKWRISGSRAHLQWIAHWLEENGIVETGRCHIYETKRSISVLSILSNYAVDALHFIYKDSSICLERKRDIYLSIAALPINRPNYWSEEEKARLADIWLNLDILIEDMLPEFEGRTAQALCAKARELRLPDRRRKSKS